MDIDINGVAVPIIYSGSKTYYPVSFIGDKILLKDLSPSQLKSNGYEKYMKQFEIDYGENTGGIQPTYCIEKNGLKEVLKRSKIGRLSVEQKVAMNGLLKHLGMEIIDTGERFIDRLSDEKIREYNLFIQDCISEVLKEKPDVKWQKCSKCGNYYPYDECFFKKNLNGGKDFDLNAYCRDCDKSGTHILHPNKKYTNVYYKDGVEWYNFVRENGFDIYSIYEYYKNNKSIYPSLLKSNITVGNIILRYYKDEILNNLDKCTPNFISEISRIPTKFITMKIIDKRIIESTKKKELLAKIQAEKRLEGISLKKVTKNLKELTFEEAVEILNDYIKDKNIMIDDVYNYDYYNLVMRTKLRYFFENNAMDVLEFIVRYYNYEYAPYKFKTRGTKFWKKRDNVDFCLRYLIEKEMRLQVEKIPLYITKYSLQQKVNSLYTILYEKRFDNNLYEWINRLYPDKFIEEDFNISITRNQFDSVEEKQIHDLLKQKFKNVIYNNRSNEGSVKLIGMMPDWFVFTDNNLYILEYFGMAVNKKTNSKRLIDYKEKTENKIEKYKLLRYGIKIYLYPDDLKNNFEGFYKKISEIV